MLCVCVSVCVDETMCGMFRWGADSRMRMCVGCARGGGGGGTCVVSCETCTCRLQTKFVCGRVSKLNQR